jgi:hypothetical protein
LLVGLCDASLSQSKGSVDMGKKYGRCLGIDVTYSTNKEGINLLNVVASRGNAEAAPLACVNIWGGSAATFARALSWVTAVMKSRGVTLKPDRVTCDDDKAEQLAIRAVWPDCDIQLCIWHMVRCVCYHDRP